MDDQRSHQPSFFSIVHNQEDRDFEEYEATKMKHNQSILSSKSQVKCKDKGESIDSFAQTTKGETFQIGEISMIKQLTNHYDNFFLDDEPSFQDSNFNEQMPSCFTSNLNSKGQICLPPYIFQCLVKTEDNPPMQVGCLLSDSHFRAGKCGEWKLEWIYKVKVAYQNYKKVLAISIKLKTLIDIDKRIKVKLHIQNDLQDEIYTVFSTLVLRKLQSLGTPIAASTQDDNIDKILMEGELIKKSKHLNKWEKRRMVLTDRIESFKNGKCTYEMKNIKELWTRFEFVEDDVVVKLRHGLEKTELGIPCVNFTLKYSANNWLYRMYRLLKISSV